MLLAVHEFIVQRFADGSASLFIAAACYISVKILDRLFMQDGSPLHDKVPRSALKWLAAISGMLAGLGGGLQMGMSAYNAIGTGLLAGLSAIGVDQMLTKGRPIAPSAAVATDAS